MSDPVHPKLVNSEVPKAPVARHLVGVDESSLPPKHDHQHVIREDVHYSDAHHHQDHHFEIRPSHSHTHHSSLPEARDYVLRREHANVHHEDITKQVEVIVENPVFRETVKQVPYDVIVERPVERIIEQEVLYEKIVETPIEKIIERPVEHVVERKVENIVETPVYYEKIYEKPVIHKVVREVETVVHKEIPLYKHYDKHIDRVSYQPVKQEVEVVIDVVEWDNWHEKVEEVHVEIPVKKIIEKHVDVIYETPVTVEREVRTIEDKYVTKYVDRPVEHIEEVEKIVKVDREVVRESFVDIVKEEKILNKQFVEMPREVIEEVEVESTQVIQVPRENHIKEIVDVIEEYDIITEEHVDIPHKVDRYVDVPVTKVRKVPREHVITKEVVVDQVEHVYREIPVVRYVDVIHTEYVDRPYDKEIEVIHEPEEIRHNRIVKEVKKVVKVPRYVTREVKRPVVKQVPVYYENRVEVPRDVYVTKRVEVPYDEIVEIEQKVFRDVETVVKKRVEIPILVEKVQESVVENYVYNDSHNVNAQSEFNVWHKKVDVLSNENDVLRSQISNLKTKVSEYRDRTHNQGVFETRVTELDLHRQALLKQIEELKVQKSTHQEVQVHEEQEQTVVRHADLGALDHEIKMLLAEKERLSTQVKGMEGNHKIISSDNNQQWTHDQITTKHNYLAKDTVKEEIITKKYVDGVLVAEEDEHVKMQEKIKYDDQGNLVLEEKFKDDVQDYVDGHLVEEDMLKIKDTYAL